MENPTDKELIDALNLLCKYMAENLNRRGKWAVEIRFAKGDCSCELFDEDGEAWEDSYIGIEPEVSSLRTMCEISMGEF